MNVEILSHTPNVEQTIATAARICYSSKTPETVYEGFSDKSVSKFIENLLKMGHMSAFEHASFTFGISGVSRVCTHQLVRHRLASYNQQSQRYVSFDKKSIKIVIPEEIAKSKDNKKAFKKAAKKCKEAYELLVEAGVEPEDARYILPGGATSNIVVTMNVRELLHFFSLRCCNRAQWEIRELAWEMLKLCREEAPTIFSTAGPSCLRGKCPEGKMTCGTPYGVWSDPKDDQISTDKLKIEQLEERNEAQFSIITEDLKLFRALYRTLHGKDFQDASSMECRNVLLRDYLKES